MEVLRELEAKLGHSEGTIDPHVFDEMMQSFVSRMPRPWERSKDFDLAAHAKELKEGAGYANIFFVDYVKGEINDRRVTDALLKPEMSQLREDLKAGRVDPDKALGQLEAHFGLDEGALSYDVLTQAVRQLPLYEGRR